MSTTQTNQQKIYISPECQAVNTLSSVLKLCHEQNCPRYQGISGDRCSIISTQEPYFWQLDESPDAISQIYEADLLISMALAADTFKEHLNINVLNNNAMDSKVVTKAIANTQEIVDITSTPFTTDNQIATIKLKPLAKYLYDANFKIYRSRIRLHKNYYFYPNSQDDAQHLNPGPIDTAEYELFITLYRLFTYPIDYKKYANCIECLDWDRINLSDYLTIPNDFSQRMLNTAQNVLENANNLETDVKDKLESMITDLRNNIPVNSKHAFYRFDEYTSTMNNSSIIPNNLDRDIFF